MLILSFFEFIPHDSYEPIVLNLHANNIVIICNLYHFFLHTLAITIFSLYSRNTRYLKIIVINFILPYLT